VLGDGGGNAAVVGMFWSTSRARLGGNGALGVLLLALVAIGGCKDEAPSVPATPTGTGATDGLPPISVTASDVGDPIAPLRPLMELRTGWCVQIRSLDDQAEAEQMVSTIESEVGQAATLLVAELGDKGTWYRVCVGAEPSRRQAAKAAARWTGRRGKLRKFMDKPKRGQARYFIKERTAAPDRLPSEAQARLLLGAEPDASRRVLLARRGKGEGFLGAVTTAPDAEGRTNVLLVDPEGKQLSLPSAPPPGCTACRAALKEGPVISREAVLVGDFLGTAEQGGGELLVVQEETDNGASYLTLAEVAPLKVIAGIWLGRDRGSLRLVTQVEREQADIDAPKELAVVRNELPVVDDGVCTLRTSVDLYDLQGGKAVHLDERWLKALIERGEQVDLARVVGGLTAALDRLGDAEAASRLCRVAVTRSTDTDVTRHCIGRIAALTHRGDPLAAVNAAGLLAEVAEGLRPAIASPMFEAAAALDQSEELVLLAPDCARRPLVPAASSRSLDENLRLAEAALAQRIDLGELVDAVFVTGRRDFGPETPVGKLTDAWMHRYKTTLSGRHAAIEALLAPVPGAGAKAP
jgi:hypothetical protein